MGVENRIPPRAAGGPRHTFWRRQTPQTPQCATVHLAPITVTGKIFGNISHKILGRNGFGYDPIFVPNKYKITFGEMSYSKKIKIDHRFDAFKKLKKKIKIL